MMQIQSELKVTVNFLLSFLYDKLPRRRVNLFGEELEKSLRTKIGLIVAATTGGGVLDAADQPFKNQLLYCLIVDRNADSTNALSMDPCLVEAAKESAMDLNEILDCLPSYLLVTIYRGKVLYKTGGSDPGQPFKTIYQEGLNLLAASSAATHHEMADLNLMAGQFDGEPTTMSQSSNLKTFLENRSKENDMLFSHFAKSSVSGISSHATSSDHSASYLDNAMRNLSLNLGSTAQNGRQFNRPACLDVEGGFLAKQQQYNPCHKQFANLDHILSSPFYSTNGLLNTKERQDLLSPFSAAASSLSPTTSPQVPAAAAAVVVAKPAKQATLFTTAEFAQTKFGSTKIKSSPPNPATAVASEPGHGAFSSCSNAACVASSKKFSRPPTSTDLSALAKQKLEAVSSSQQQAQAMMKPNLYDLLNNSPPADHSDHQITYSTLLTLLTGQQSAPEAPFASSSSSSSSRVNIENLLALSSQTKSAMENAYGQLKFSYNSYNTGGSSTSSSPLPFSPSSTVTSPQSPLFNQTSLLINSRDEMASSLLKDLVAAAAADNNNNSTQQGISI